MDPLALGIARLRRPVAVAEIGGLALALHARRDRAEMHRRFPVKALVGKAAAVDADVETGFFERAIADSFPARPDRLDLARAAAETVELAGLRAETLRPDPPRRHQEMRVIIPLVAVPVGSMDREVDGDTVALDERSGELPHRRQPLLMAELMR